MFLPEKGANIKPLYERKGNPIQILINQIQSELHKILPNAKIIINGFENVVSKHVAFDSLEIDENHSSRSEIDNFTVESQWRAITKDTLLNRFRNKRNSIYINNFIFNKKIVSPLGFGNNSIKNDYKNSLFMSNSSIEQISYIRKLASLKLNQQEGVWRPHATSEQIPLSNALSSPFIFWIAPVFRRDTVDATHYPVFYQLDGVMDMEELKLRYFELKGYIENSPKRLLEIFIKQLMSSVFKNAKYTVDSNATFPFTSPSFEIYANIEKRELELAGAGIMNETIRPNKKKLAFGIGLDRLAMCVFKIPDIRILWSLDQIALNKCLTYFNKEFNFKLLQKFDINRIISKSSSERHISLNININEISDALEVIKDLLNILYTQEKIWLSMIPEVSLIEKGFFNNKSTALIQIKYKSNHSAIDGNKVNLIQRQLENYLKSSGYLLR